MDTTTILDSLDALTVADLRKVARAAADLLAFYEEMARQPPDNVLEQRGAPGGCFRLELVRCGKGSCRKCAGGAYGHGPYWYKYTSAKGRRRKVYIGKELSGKVDS